jgi:hypothetical protein
MNVLTQTSGLITHIMQALDERSHAERFFPENVFKKMSTSSVLFLLSPHCEGEGGGREPCLILNKRSLKVRQPGDLCCPGGGISPRLDFWLANLLILPFFPLARWPYWSSWRRRRQSESRLLALLLATSLRESFEEMRLNPLNVRFLGPLPPQRLVMFRRVIYPMVAWTPSQKRFHPNWEVDKLVYIPLQSLLNPSNYAKFRLNLEMSPKKRQNRPNEDLPCFMHHTRNEKELLWGATYRIATVFLEFVFGFKPPGLDSLPVVHGNLDETYLSGSR